MGYNIENGDWVANGKMDQYNFNELEPQEPRRSRLKIILYLGMVLLLITGLLWSAISGVAWLVRQSQPRTETADLLTTPAPESAPVRLATPGPEQRINRIVFINPAGQVETIAPDGRNRRLISDEPFSFRFPAWSPTGEYVAALGGDGLYRLTDGPEPEALELHANGSRRPFYLYWSPDGRSLAFLTNHSLGIGLYIVPADGSVESRFLVTGSPFYWDWTAASDQILIHTGFNSEEARLGLLDVSNGRGGPDVAQPGLFQAPDISRDGRYWAYAELDGNGLGWLVAADSQTGAVQRQRHAGQVALGWSPAADQLAFISTGDEAFDFVGPLRLMDAATGEVRLLSRETVLAFFWSPDGCYLAAITGEEALDGVIAKGNGRHASKSARQSHPSISLNLLLIDVTSGERRDLLTFHPTTTFITQFLPFFDQYALSHRLWSPDSDALVLPTRENGTDRIIIVSIDDGQPRQLVEGDMSFWSQQ